MMTPPRIAHAVLSFALGAGCVAPVVAQSVADTLQYPDEDAPASIVLYLDSLIVVSDPAAPPGTVPAALPEGVDVARTLEPGVFVLGLDDPAADRIALFGVARRIRESETAIEHAGPLIRRPGSSTVSLGLDQIIVLFHSETPEDEMRASVAAARLVTAEVSANQRHLRLLDLGDPPPDPYQALIDLQADPDVLAASPQFIAFLPPPPPPTGSPATSPDVPAQWHHALVNTAKGWELVDENAPAATIAVIENHGFDSTNVDVQASLWLNGSDPTNNDIDDDLNGLIDDTRGWSWTSASTDFDTGLMSFHGTAVAGLAAGAGRANDGVPEDDVVGICPNCTLMLLDAGLTDWGRAQAFLYARDRGASVINASWYDRPEWVLRVIIERVGSTGRDGLGLPIVFAASNIDVDVCTGPDAGYQALPQVITVAATDANDIGVTGNGHGNCIALAAPGYFDPLTTTYGLTADDNSGQQGLNYDVSWAGCSLANDPDFGSPFFDYTRCFKGTSASAPLVSGAIGLMLMVHPQLAATEIRSILTSSAVEVLCAPGAVMDTCYPGGVNRDLGHGRLDVGAAVAAAADLVPNPCDCAPPSWVVIIILICCVVFCLWLFCRKSAAWSKTG